MIIWLGIILGFATAWGHSLAYLASRWFTVEKRGSALQLLVIAHVQLGVIGIATMPMTWPAGLHWDWSWSAPVLLGIAALIVSQTALFGALKHADASMVAPMLSVKIAVLSAIAWGWYGHPQSLMQITGVVLAVLGALLLHGLGTRPPWQALVWGGVMIFGYAICDTTINAAIDAVASVQTEETTAGRLRSGVFVATLLYTGTGVASAVMLPWFGSRSRRVWLGALPYAGAWTFAMMTLYSTFALLGAVYGAILQNTRVLWSIVLGGFIAHRGWAHLETPHGRGVMASRVVAAVLLIGAIALYAWGRPA